MPRVNSRGGPELKMFVKAEKEELERSREQIAGKVTDKYLRLFNSIDEGFCIIEIIFGKDQKAIDYRFLETNPAFVKHTSLENAVGKRMKELVPDHEESWFRTYGEIAKTGEAKRFEHFASRLGTGRWYEVYAFCIDAPEKNQVAVLFSDITERKKAETTLRENEKRLAEELEISRDLQKVSSSLVESNNIGLLYKKIMDASISILHSQAASIQLFVPENGALHLLSSQGFHPESAKLLEWVEAGSGSGCGVALAKNKRVVVPDIENWDATKSDEDRKPFRLSGIRAMQSTPLISRTGKIVGMLSNHWDHVHEPTERELNFLDVLAGQAADVIESKNSEMIMRVSEERFRLLADNSPALIWMNGLEGANFVNRAYLEFLGVTQKDVSKYDWAQFVHPDDRNIYLNGYLATFAEGKIFEAQFRFRRADGEYRWMKTIGLPRFAASGEVQGYLGSTTDINDVKLAEEKIRESEERLKRLNASLQQEVHKRTNELNVLNAELRHFNDITANNYTETLRHVYINLETIVTTDARNLSNSSRANIRRAQAAVQKLKLLTDDINHYLELYDVGIKKELIDPVEILIYVKEKMQKRIEDSNTTINVTKLPKLNAESLLFSKVMTNLVDNSIKFKKPDADPIINISSSWIADANSVSENNNNTAYTIITVTDNGIGFNEEDANKVFELFTQLDDKHKGSGIGLAVCKKIMEMHGGFIKAESKPGEGTSIHCYFPA